jgi:hypothetical protein
MAAKRRFPGPQPHRSPARRAGTDADAHPLRQGAVVCVRECGTRCRSAAECLQQSRSGWSSCAGAPLVSGGTRMRGSGSVAVRLRYRRNGALRARGRCHGERLTARRPGQRIVRALVVARCGRNTVGVGHGPCLVPGLRLAGGCLSSRGGSGDMMRRRGMQEYNREQQDNCRYRSTHHPKTPDTTGLPLPRRYFPS